jgi:antitoxin component HigA of HigAB toxin-antitoxin module
MYIKNDAKNREALDELEKLMDLDAPTTTQEKRLLQLTKAITRYESWRYGDSLEDTYERTYAWQLKHPEAVYHKPEHHPDDSNHTRHKLRELYRKSDKMQQMAERAGR